VYLSCVFYNEDRILVTTEDNLPIVEVDESLSAASIQTDFDWLMKVSSPLWDMARQLKQDLEKLNNLSSVHLRQQLLNAVLQLQVGVIINLVLPSVYPSCVGLQSSLVNKENFCWSRHRRNEVRCTSCHHH